VPWTFLGRVMAIRPAFAAVRTIFALVEYFVHPPRFFFPATQSPFVMWPATRRWSRRVADPGPEIVKTNLPWESLSFETVGTRGFGFAADVVPAAPDVVPAEGAGSRTPGPVWPRKNAYIAAVSSGPFASA